MNNQSKLDNFIESNRLQSFEELEQIVQLRRDKKALKKARKLDDSGQTKLF